MNKKLTYAEVLTLLERLISEQPSGKRAAGFLIRLRRLRDLVSEQGQEHETDLAEIPLSLLSEEVFRVADSSLRTTILEFRKALKRATESVGIRLDFIRPDARSAKSEEIFCTFEGAPLPKKSKLIPLSDRATAAVRQGHLIRPPAALMTGAKLEELLTATTDTDDRGRVRAKFFISYTRKDGPLVRKLLEKLEIQLKISKEFDFSFWQDKEILLGEDWHDSILKALHDCDFALALVSPGFFATDYILKHELPPLVEGEKPVIPVEVAKLDYERSDLQGLEARQIFKLEENDRTRSFAECRGQVADRFVSELSRKIEKRVEDALRQRAIQELMVALRDPERLASLAAKCPSLEGWMASEEPDEASHEPISSLPRKQKFAEMFSKQVSAEKLRDNIRVLCGAMGLKDVEGLVTKSPTDEGNPYQRFREHQQDAIKFLQEWFQDSRKPPFAAVLGEIGSGKTTMLQMLAHEINQDPEAPGAVFIDLRDHGMNKDGTLEAILTEHLRRYGDGDLSVEDVRQAVQEERTLIIFDGLDEKVIPMSDGERQQFVKELWRILPPEDPKKPKDVNRGRLIISCRSHYFPSVQAQSSGYLAQDREGVTESDYVACVMLPWQEEQIRDYLAGVLGEDRVEPALEVIAAVHNLTDLAQRPYLIHLIAPELESLERERAEGRSINAASLYAKFIDRWLHRDDGKHVLTLEHKKVLMGALAASLWQENVREWPWTKVSQWLERYFHEHPVMAGRYKRDGVPAKAIEQDFRTATFFLRPDSSKEAFRFAHTSLLEYFLASHLVRALDEPDRAATVWDLPMPSQESLEFAAQLLELESGNRLESLADLLDTTEIPSQARRNALAYWRMAAEHNWPLPKPVAPKLQDLELEHWHFRDMDLRGASFGNSSLRYTRFEHVKLQGSNFSCADATRAEFHNCAMSPSTWTNAKLTGSTFRSATISTDDLAGADTHDAWVNFQDLDVHTTSKPETLHLDSARVQFGRSYSSCFSSDGNRIASAGYEVVRIWDARSGRCLHVLRGHFGSVLSCSFSGDGSHIVSAGADGTVRVWEATSGRCVHVLREHSGPVLACAFSNDSRKIVSAGSDHTVRLWDAHSGCCRQAIKGHSGHVLSCAFSNDDDRIISCGDAIRAWDCQSGRSLFVLEAHAHESIISCSFSNDGTRIVSSDSNSTLRLWDTNTGRCLHALKEHSGNVLSCDFSDDGTRIVSSGSDSIVRIWDSKSGRCLHVLNGHKGWATSCAFSSDGKHISSTGWDGSIRVWETETGRCLHILREHASWVRSAAFTSGGAQIVTGGDDGRLRVWDADSCRCLHVLKAHSNVIWSSSISTDGKRMVSASSDRTVRVWDVQTGRCLHVLHGHEGRVSACAISADGSRIASAGWDRTLRIWSTESGQLIDKLPLLISQLDSCAFSPDGNRVVMAGNNKTLRIWEPESLDVLDLEGHLDNVNSASFSRDGTLIVSAGDDSTVRLWDAESGRRLHVLKDHSGSVLSSAFSNDGKRIVSAGSDSTVRVWDAESGRCLQVLKEHSGIVWSSAFSSDGKRIVSCGSEGNVSVWDAETYKLLYCTFADGEDYAVADFENNKILGASPGGWRLLAWRGFDKETGEPKLYPAEAFGPLPEL